MHIVYSNAHEFLLEILCEKILSSSSLRQVLIFPSQALKVFYSDEICERLGSTLSLDLILPDEIQEISIELGSCCPTQVMKKSWRASDYRLALLQLFLEFEKSGQQEDFKKWLEGSPLEMALKRDPQAKSALAASLATLFCSYSQWALSKECFEKPISDWQSFLWFKVHQILDPSYCLAAQWLALAEKMKAFPKEVQVHLIGFSQAAPGFLKWVEKASGNRPCLWYVHSPSRLYWHDLESYLRGQKQLAKLSAASSAYDQLQALLLDRNPLLASLCQVARPLMQYLELKQSDSFDAYGLFSSVEDQSAYQELWWEGIKQKKEPLTVLSALQADMLLMRPLHEAQPLEIADVESLRIYKGDCLDQEVAIILERISELLAKDENLEPSDFMVLAPDIHLYRGFIERHFDPLFKELPYKILDSRPKDVSGAKSFVLSLLSFATGLWNWENLQDLLQEPWLIKEANGFKIANWFLQVGKEHRVSWGLSLQHRLQLAQENEWHLIEETDKGCWRGFWSSVFEAGVLVNAEEIVGEGIETQEARLAKTFFSILEKELKPWTSRECLSPTAWLKQLEALLKQIAPSSYDDFAFLEPLHNDLQTYGCGMLCGHDFNEMLKSQLEDSPTFWTSKREGLLRFASLQPMRALPVKHLFIMGLSQQHFPAGQPKMEYEWTPQEGIGVRPNSSEILRFAFLESILSARKSLCLTYGGKLEMPALPCAILANLMAYLKVAFRSFEAHQEVISSLRRVSPSLKALELEKHNKPLPTSLSLYQIQWALSDPLRVYLDHLWQIKEDKKREEGSEVAIQRSFIETYSRLAQMDHKIEIHKLLSQWEKGALSHLENDLWKSRLESHREYRKEYLGLELQEPICLWLSQGRRWLGLEAEWSENVLYSQSALIGTEPSFEITGQTQGFDPKDPQVVVKRAAKDARNDLMRALVHLAISFHQGLIQKRTVLLIPRQKGDRIKVWDLSHFDEKSWLDQLASYLKACFTSPILFTNELHTEALGDSYEEYEEMLCSQIQDVKTKRGKKYSLQYMWGMFSANPSMWEVCLKHSFEILNRELKELYKPILEIYPLSAKKGKDDEEF